MTRPPKRKARFILSAAGVPERNHIKTPPGMPALWHSRGYLCLCVFPILACIPEGAKSMVTVLITMTGSFILNAANTEMGLTEYVLDTVTPLISGPVFPMVTFLVLSALSFATASPWAMATVAFPIIMPLAMAVNANLFMAAGALISGAAFGSHACFYGDGAILTCAACGIDPFDYGRTSIPLIMVHTVIASIGYLILGFIMM